MFLQARVTQWSAFPKGRAGGVWLLNVVLGSSWPSRAYVLAGEPPCAERWRSGGPGLPSPAGRADGIWRGELWTGDTDRDKLRWLMQQSAIS